VVSFYWAEAPALHLPEQLTEKINNRYCCMVGTNQPSPRCHALEGRVGLHAACNVYDRRPSPAGTFRLGTKNALRLVTATASGRWRSSRIAAARACRQRFLRAQNSQRLTISL
jgi:hypothetical protein